MAKTRTPAAVRQNQRRQKLEDCAFAAYQMERGEYHYPKGVHRGYKKPDGTRDWNRAEIMRIYGWEHSGNYDAVLEDPHFKKALEYHRWRGSDPEFQKRANSQIWQLTVDEAAKRVYERVLLHGDDLSLDQFLKVIKTYVDCGLKLSSEAMKDKADELLGTLDEGDRAKLVAEQRKELERQLADLASLEGAVEKEYEDD